MRVLQTLGHLNGMPPTPFYYRRGQDGVRVESIVGRKIRQTIPNDVWTVILTEINAAGSDVLGVSSSSGSELQAPKLHDLIARGSNVNETRLLAYISAILVHEGSLYFDHGPRHDDLDARVFLRVSKVSDVDFATRHPET